MAAKLSQTALANAADATRNFVSLVELGETNITLSKLLALAAALETTATTLIAEAETEAN